MAKRDDPQKSAQNHAAGEDDDKTRDAFIGGLHGSEESEGAPHRAADVDEYGRPITGKGRPQEERQKHDESEKKRNASRVNKHGR